MKTLTPFILVLTLGIGLSQQGVWAQTHEIESVRRGETALVFASGGIQKTTPRDGIVNLITGDNQTAGNRMLLGKSDGLYLKLDNPSEVSIGDLFTVYRRVRKVFHPVTREYLGFVMIRLAIVRVTDNGHALSPAETIVSYGPIAPGDPVTRFVAHSPEEDVNLTAEVGDLSGMIVELQADRPMTLVSQADVVYVDRGRQDGVKAGDLMDLYRHSAGLPPRKIGQLKVLSTEDRTATARVAKAYTRVMKGDRYKLAGYSEPVSQPVPVIPAKTEESTPVPADLVASKLKVQDASGQTRINLGEAANFLRYDSGEAAIKPEGYQVLDQLIEHLRTSGDTRLIRIEGHTDNVEIGPSLKPRYPSNWELSKARASGVVRYLVEKGGLDSARLTSVGYGDSKPVATNEIEEGRTKNRRVEILLYGPDSDPQVSKPDEPGQVQKQDGHLSTLSAREDHDQPAVPQDDSATAGVGGLSIGERQDVPAGDGPSTASSPDASGTVPPDAGQQVDSQPTEQPVE